MNLRLTPEMTLTKLRSELDALPDSSALTLDAGSVVSPEIRNAVDGLARGFGCWRPSWPSRVWWPSASCCRATLGSSRQNAKR